MSDGDIERLKKEIADLRAELAQMRADVMEFHRIFMAESELTTEHMLGQDREIIDIFTYLMPLVRRAYSGIDASTKQLRGILKSAQPRDGKAPDTKDSG
jgi:hypothetical protein